MDGLWQIEKAFEEAVGRDKAMSTITVEIPAELVEELKLDKEKIREALLLGLTQLKIQEALALYQKGYISIAKAARMAGIPLREMMRQAAACGVEPRISEQMIQEELG